MHSILLNGTPKLQNEANQHNMSYDEYARWLCLIEGIDIVGKRIEQIKARAINNDVDWIKPLAFQKYIEERFLSMKSDLEELEHNTNKTVQPNKVCTTSLVPALV